jgi:hypothetical protein
MPLFRNLGETLAARTYRVIVIVRRTGKRIVLCPGPFTHAEACIVLSKASRHPWRIETIEEIT